MTCCVIFSQEQKLTLAPSEAELRSEALKELPLLAQSFPEKSLFRRNRAKGPNPLSVKCKQGKMTRGSKPEAAQQPAKRKRRRGKGAVGPDAAAVQEQS